MPRATKQTFIVQFGGRQELRKLKLRGRTLVPRGVGKGIFKKGPFTWWADKPAMLALAGKV